ncbi:NAD(P)/FAD-dependent oxidoreductase [Streptomyces sp. CA-106131]|uniref:NAD(P)/FAD-dependent oxidoreductase n=1 Tax=Streptomyces sp. CA-106131 TaxID=3240045 RepID=UPI003D8E0519
MSGPIVVVGAGQAGFQAAVSLRETGFAGPLTIVGDEPGLPYQRPPLSKAYLLASPDDPDTVTLRPQAFFERHTLKVVHDPAVAIDRPRSRVRLRSGRAIPYAHLVLAVGARARKLPVPGSDLDRVLTLRTRAEADVLRGLLREGIRVVVIGGGFIGMEVAAAARKAGAHAIVIETLDRVMARVVSPETSAHVEAVHADQGTAIVLGRSVTALHGVAGTVSEVELDDGRRIPADVVVVGIGVVPNTELAQCAGLEVGDGIVVDEQLLTADPRISAIGDCASYPSKHAGSRARLESVQNAVDHAHHVATRLTGAPSQAYAQVPWFWTHQFGMRIQTAGIGRADDLRVLHGDPTEGKFSVCRYQGDRLVAVESVNRTGDHIGARKVLAGAQHPTPHQVTQPGFTFKAFAAQTATAAR